MRLEGGEEFSMSEPALDYDYDYFNYLVEGIDDPQEDDDPPDSDDAS